MSTQCLHRSNIKSHTFSNTKPHYSDTKLFADTKPHSDPNYCYSISRAFLPSSKSGRAWLRTILNYAFWACFLPSPELLPIFIQLSYGAGSHSEAHCLSNWHAFKCSKPTNSCTKLDKMLPPDDGLPSNVLPFKCSASTWSRKSVKRQKLFQACCFQQHEIDTCRSACPHMCRKQVQKLCAIDKDCVFCFMHCAMHGWEQHC